MIKQRALVPSALVLFSLAPALDAAEVAGELKRWHTVTLTFDGPESAEDADFNPFTQYRLDVNFVHPASGTRHTVPGFFAADGRAAETSAVAGNKWRVRFAPPTTGVWEYQAAMWSGLNAAASANTIDLQRVELDESSGKFEVGPSDKPFSDFRSQGSLRYVGERYLQFAGSKRYFLKAGADSPETLLAYHDFDGTSSHEENPDFPAATEPIELPSLEGGLHRYQPHAADWRDGDPTWADGKGKGLIGGVNYLADQGVNSLYFLTMNVNADGRNVWPWTGPWTHDRFDVSKLAQWEILFSHMQRRGIQLHVVLQETENDHLLDGGDLGPARKLYLREMVARFAHHPALQWNLGEENLQSPAQKEAMAEYLRALDPYDHPLVIHNDHWQPTNLAETFDALLGGSVIDGTAIQDFNWNDVHAHVKRYVAASRAAGKPWFVCTDEMGGANFGLRTDADDPDHFAPRAKGLWGNLMAGGAGVEWYFGWQNNSPHSDLSAETWRPREAMWRQSRIAVDFFQQHLPFPEMNSADELIQAQAAYCFAKPGDVYCIYLISGGATRLDLQNHRGPFTVRWFNPRRGGQLQRGKVDAVWGPGWVDVGEPPREPDRDWVVLVRRVDPVFASRDDGAVVVEAEHFERQEKDGGRRWYALRKSGALPELAGAGNPTTWVRSMKSAAATASEQTFLRLLPDTRRTHGDRLIRGENFSPEPGKLAVLTYRVDFPEPGRYYVWVRAYSTGTEDNGLHVGLGGEWPASGQRMQWCQGKNSWRWECAQRTQEQHCGVPMGIYLDVEQAGEQIVQFSMREDGFAFDKFLLTTDRGYRPAGEEAGEALTGQAASAMDAEPSSNVPKHSDGPGLMRFPAHRWARGTPESQGLDSARLQSALDFLAGHCQEDGLSELMIIRNGVCVFDGSNTDNVHNIWSCSKSFTSTALGLLIDEGKCELDTKAASIEPVLAEKYPGVTLRHFTTMTSGYSAEGRSRWNDENADWSQTPYEPAEPYFPPGEAYAYWDEAMMMLGRVLTRLAGCTLNEYLTERVFQPIGMGPVEWGYEGDVDGVPICNGCTNVKLSARQLARFGHLYLNRGNWNGRQVIPAGWVDAATTAQVPVSVPIGETDRRHVRGSGAYGYNWWVNGGLSSMPEAPPKTFYASGLNHNVCVVIPEWNMVVVRMGVDGNPPFGKHNVYNRFLGKLAEAL